VDRAVNPAPAEERRVRGVHDRVDLLRGHVSFDELDPHARMMPLRARSGRVQ
jgi:hypothetical protein